MNSWNYYNLNVNAVREYVEISTNLTRATKVRAHNVPAEWRMVAGRYKRYPWAPLYELVSPKTSITSRMLGSSRGKYDLYDLLTWGCGVIGFGIDPWPTHVDVLRYHRVMPSGGAFFPLEVYLRWQGRVYHFHPVTYQLAEIGEDPSRDKLSVVITTRIQKNLGKYGHLGFRLQNLDAGHLASTLEWIAQALGAQVKIRLVVGLSEVAQALCLDINQELPLLQIELQAEEWHGEISLVYPGNPALSSTSVPDRYFAHPETVRFIQNLYREVQSVPASSIYRNADIHFQAPTQWQPDLNLIKVLSQRRSGPDLFMKKQIPKETWQQLLIHALPQKETELMRRLRMFCFIHNVEGIEPGIYELKNRELKLLRTGSFMPILQNIYTVPNINMDKVAVAVFFVGNYAELSQEEEAINWFALNNWSGRIGQRFYLGVSALELTGISILSYKVDEIDHLLGIRGTGSTAMFGFLCGNRIHSRRLEINIKGGSPYDSQI